MLVNTLQITLKFPNKYDRAEMWELKIAMLGKKSCRLM